MGKKRPPKWVKKLRKFAPVFIITLIGMPAAGKTKVGRMLAKLLGWDFVDIDRCIEEHCGVNKLQELVDTLSAKQFAKLESDIAIETVCNITRPTVIATGGSMVYHKRAIEVLQEKSVVIYLRASLPTIIRRVKRKPNRGIVYGRHKDMAGLYRFRTRLYKRAKDVGVSANHHRARVAEKLAKRIKRALAA